MELRFPTRPLPSGANCHRSGACHALLSSDRTSLYLCGAHHTGRKPRVNSPVPPRKYCQPIFCIRLHPRSTRTLLRLVQKPPGRPVVSRSSSSGLYDLDGLSGVLSGHGTDKPVGGHSYHKHARSSAMVRRGSHRAGMRTNGNKKWSA